MPLCMRATPFALPDGKRNTSPLPSPAAGNSPAARRSSALVEVRQAGAVAPFAVVGFIAVAIFAALVLFSHAQSTVLNAEIVELRGQLTTLEAENAKLSAQYEQVFDMAAIQSAVGEGMTRPNGSQVVYLDLSEPDTVVVFDKLKDSRVMDTMKNVGRALGDMIEYFR